MYCTPDWISYLWIFHLLQLNSSKTILKSIFSNRIIICKGCLFYRRFKKRPFWKISEIFLKPVFSQFPIKHSFCWAKILHHKSTWYSIGKVLEKLVKMSGFIIRPRITSMLLTDVGDGFGYFGPRHPLSITILALTFKNVYQMQITNITMSPTSLSDRDHLIFERFERFERFFSIDHLIINYPKWIVFVWTVYMFIYIFSNVI